MSRGWQRNATGESLFSQWLELAAAIFSCLGWGPSTPGADYTLDKGRIGLRRKTDKWRTNFTPSIPQSISWTFESELAFGGVSRRFFLFGLLVIFHYPEVCLFLRMRFVVAAGGENGLNLGKIQRPLATLSFSFWDWFPSMSSGTALCFPIYKTG